MALLRKVTFIFVFFTAKLVTQAGQSQLLPSHTLIAQHFDVTDPSIQSWFIPTYSLTICTFDLISSRLGDLFSHKFMFIIAVVWFGIFSIVAGSSYYENSTFFCVSRAVQDIGSSILLPNGLALLGATYSPG